MKNLIKCFALLLFIQSNNAQEKLTIKDSILLPCEKCYSRSIAELNDRIIVGTSNGGVFSVHSKSKSIQQIIPPIEKGEVRDLAIIGQTIYAMYSGDNGLILSYSDKNGIDTLFYKKGLFLDAIDVYQKQLIVLGDPEGATFFTVKINTKTKEIISLPPLSALEKEACYAASGTTAFVDGNHYSFVSGGGKWSRIHSIPLNKTTENWSTNELPLESGEGKGPFSALHLNNMTIVVGGNYMQPKDTSSTGVYFNATSSEWKKFIVSPFGYRSCVMNHKKTILSCGSNGLDRLELNSNKWYRVITGNFCTLHYSKKSASWWVSTNKNKLYIMH